MDLKSVSSEGQKFTKKSREDSKREASFGMVKNDRLLCEVVKEEHKGLKRKKSQKIDQSHEWNS